MNFTKTAQDLQTVNQRCGTERLTGGPTGQRDPLDSDTETGESSSPAELDDGEVSGETKGIYVFLSSR